MRRIMLTVIAAAAMSACQNSGDGSESPDSTSSITPAATKDTATTIAPMMGDTSKTEADSLKK